MEDENITYTTKTSFGEKQINIRLTGEFKEKCEESAKCENISFNEWVRRAMVDRLSGDSREKNARIEQLTHSLDISREEIIHHEKTISNLSNEISFLKGELSDLIAKYNDRIKTAEYDADILRKSIGYLNENNDKLIKQLKESDKKISHLVDENKILKIDKITLSEDSETKNIIESLLKINDSPAIKILEKIESAIKNNGIELTVYDDKCPKCNAPINENDRECPKCHHPVNNKIKI